MLLRPRKHLIFQKAGRIARRTFALTFGSALLSVHEYASAKFFLVLAAASSLWLAT
jgi:hypothetical protein